MKRSTKDEVITQATVQVRETEYPEGERTEARTVRCPMTKASVPLERCFDCERYASFVSSLEGASTLGCRVPPEAAQGPVTRTSLEACLSSTTVAEVMTTTVTCVDSEMDLQELALLFERKNLRSAPVVEDEGVLLGMVSESELIRGHSPDAAEEPSNRGYGMSGGVLVEDVMSTEVVRLKESDSLNQAVNRMVHQRVHTAPVVSNEDVVVGILALGDVMRWLAAQLGKG